MSEASISSLDPESEEAQAIVRRLRRAHGQLGGIVRMIEADRDCSDIVTQLAAVSKALDRAGFALIAANLRECLLDPEHHPVDVDALQKLFLTLA